MATVNEWGLISILPSRFPGLFLRDDSTPVLPRLDQSGGHPMRFREQGDATDYRAGIQDEGSRMMFTLAELPFRAAEPIAEPIPSTPSPLGGPLTVEGLLGSDLFAEKVRDIVADYLKDFRVELTRIDSDTIRDFC